MADDLDLRLEALTEADFERGMAVFRAGLKESEIASMNACVRCGFCTDSCHYHRTEPILENIPARKLDQVASVFRGHFTPMGRILPALTGAKRMDKAMAKAWVDAVFGRCSLCGRCSLNCAVGIHLPAIFKAARAALFAMGLVPADLQATVDLSLETGNNMGISRSDWLETVEWIEEELQAELDDPSARIPVDKVGARVLFTVNPREPKFFPLSLQASAKVFHAAGEDWTVASEGWDLTNYGLFNGSPEQGGALNRNLIAAMERLGCELLVIGECGHGYASARWEGPEWQQATPPFKVVSILELMRDYVREGRLVLDPEKIKQTVTLHDPCNLVRHGGLSEPQREVLRAAVPGFVEMAENRNENYCCGGGGGQLAMGAYKARRLKSGGSKAEQIRKTGAKLVVAPCHNCIDQLSELNKEYKLGVKVLSLAELISDAIVLPEKASEVTP